MRIVFTLAIFLGLFIGATAGTALAQTPPSAVVVLTSQQTAYGAVLFTGDGKALYMLSYDTVGTANTPAVSSCTGTCAAAWPPLLASNFAGPFQTEGGVQARALGTIVRPDSTFQVTYFGHPLYMFVRDTAAGQINGQNVGAFNGLWNLVTVQGQPDPGTATVTLEASPAGQVLATPTAFGAYRSLYDLSADYPNVSTCFQDCARFWPPLLTAGQPTAGTGVDPAGLGTIRRPDGTLQVTYFGVPIYLFAFDLGPGAKSGLTNGEDFVDQAANGIWYLVSPHGISAPAPATIGASTTGFGATLNFAKSSVYAFSGDSTTSSACTGVCARTWIPVITTGNPQAAAGAGLNPAALGTFTRADGTTQVTYNGHPLYNFALDFAGTSGQGSSAYGGTFNLVQADGTLAAGTPAQRPVIAMPQVIASPPGTSSSFVVSFTSTAAGQAMVLFGTGPGCIGLVETALRDQGAGTTNHTVVVTGNDLPGTVGDNGIQPGTTYFFEVVTTTGSGTLTDNNSGACYSVTIPVAAAASSSSPAVAGALTNGMTVASPSSAPATTASSGSSSNPYP